MILSEHERRWVEVRFYHFMMDLYRVRNKSVDIVDVVECICVIGRLNLQLIKKVVNMMLSDQYYQPQKREIILLGHLHHIAHRDLGKYLGISRQSVFRYVQANLDTYTPIPRCDIDADIELDKFIKTWDKVRKAGLYVDTD